MDLDPRHFFNVLYKHLEDETSGPKQCNQLFVNLNDLLTNAQINLPDLDLFLQYLFHKTQGLPDVVTKIVNKKPFKTSVKSIFDLIYTLINNFSTKLGKYIPVIYEICFKIVKSSLVNADEKVKALDVIILSFGKINKSFDFPECYAEVYKNLFHTVAIKKSDTVQGKIFNALGAFAQHFQYLVTNHEALRNNFLNALESQMVQKEFSYGLIGGVFTGLDSFCESFPFDPNSKEDAVIIKKICKYIERLTVPSTTIKIGNRAALRFLGNNISLFVNLMLEKIQNWHENLLKWLTFGSDDQKVGVFVVEAFYRGLGNHLMNDTSQQHKDLTMYFVEYFKSKLSSSSTSNCEKRLCLQGLSSFSGICQLQLDEEQRKDLLILLVQSFEQSFILIQEPSSDILEDLPFYLQTVAKFVHFRKITNSELFCLQKATILMVKAYPQLPYSSHEAVIKALVSTFYFLASNDEKVFDNFVENVIYQGVVWSCSHQHISEAEALESTQKVLTVKSYFSLWRHLLGILPLRNFDKLGIFLNDRKYILIKIVDKLMRTLLILINKLNVSIVLNNIAESVTDIQAAYKVAEVNDFAIFLNVVDFYEEIFEAVDPNILTKCAYKLIHHLISKCDQFPLISGFSKLLSFTLKVCNKDNYFSESNVAAQDVKMCTLTLTIFADSLLNKTQQYKGDLLIASLQLLLQYPIVIIRKMLPACAPAFRTIFYVGRNYLKLAHMALDTLEYWQKEIPSAEMQDFLVQVVPLLDYYLQSKSLGSFSEPNLQETRTKTARALQKRKVVVNVEPELVRLQMRIIKFIGGQANTLCEAFAFREDNIPLSVWSNQQHLKVVLPYEDIKLEIYLDKLLPRIVNVALNSSDRKTRIMACELLQAVIMIFLGTSKQMSQLGLSDLNELLRHVTVPLLKLGCDMDKVVEQLFKPLCFQLIHWYTHSTQLRQDHSAIVIEAILESITHPTDTALRDFSGKCINEFVKWTIKQTSEKNLARDPINIKILVKKMRFYSMHPDPYKKLGAALIFNNIYKELREESSLLSIFWIEFLHIFVKSLSTYEFDAFDENPTAHIKSALKHLERGFIEKSDLFNSKDKDRRVPTDFKGEVLKDVAVWLLEETGSPSRYCREFCMELFCSIAAKTEQFTTLQNFVSKHFKRKNWVQEVYEAFLVQHPTLESLSDHESVGPNKWMQAFLCAVDGYKFVITYKLVATDNILSETIIKAISYFLCEVSTTNLEGVLGLVQLKHCLFTTFEKQTFDKQRSQAVIKLLQLLNALSPKIDIFYTPELWSLIINLIFKKEVLGFECFLPSSNMDTEISKLVKEFLSKLPNDKSVELKQVLAAHISENLVTDVDFKSYVPLKQRNVLKGLNMLLSFSLPEHFSFQEFTNGMVAKLLNNFVDNAEGGIIYAHNLQDTTLSYCLSVLDFALPNPDEFKVFFDFLYKPYQVQTADYKQPILLGTYCLTLFEDSVMDKIIKNFELFLQLSLENNTMIKQTTESIYHILSYTIPQRRLKYVNETVVYKLLQKWEIFENHFNDNVEAGLDFVKCLIPVIKSSKLQCENLKKWLNGLLLLELNSSWKFELDLKAETFYLLVDVMDDLDDENTDLKDGLIHLKTTLLFTSSVPPEAKTVFLDKLLCVTPKIRTPEILLFLLDLYVKINTEKSCSDMKTLLRDYIINAQQTQKVSLSKLYSLYLSEDFDNIQKYKLLTNTTAVFQFCNISVLEDFFVNNILEIMTDLKETLTSHNVVNKICQFVLIEILFLRHPIRSLETNEISKIAQAAISTAPSNKKLAIQILKTTIDAVKDTVDADDGFLRLYKCHSYNTTASIVSNSLKTAAFFAKLFVRQQDDVDILWKNLIDTNRVYAFGTDFETIPNRRKILVNIRNDMRAKKKTRNSQSQSVRYVESMRVYNSSLSEDCSKFDFSNSTVRNGSEDEVVVTSEDQSEIELDSTDINNHECMATVCGMIQLMVDTNMLELPTDDEDTDYELPAWLNGVRSLLLNSETHNNIKMFWIKVIDNLSHIFEHIAKWFLEPLLKFVTDKCAGTNINYFITDVVAILAAWSTAAPPTTPSEIQLSSDLLTFLITNLNNERRDMFKYHLELIRLLIEAWKSMVTVPYELLFSKLSVDPTSQKVEIGVHLFSIFLANKAFPWEDKTIEFCKSVFDVIMKSKLKSSYKPAAESVGLLLRLKNDPKLFKNVHVLLKKISDPEKYAYILECVVLHFPEIADDFHVKVLLSRLHGVPKPLKLVYLRVILSRSKIMNTIDEFKTEEWNSYIENDDLEVQVVALQIVYECLEVIRHSSLFKNIIESVCGHVLSSYVLCRSRMFDILISIYQGRNYPKEILDLCKPVLVQGLTDADTEIRDKIYDFWKNNHELPTPISSRFSFVLSNLYETVTENSFLGYSCYILLDIIKTTDEYNSLLFEHPLEDCEFENYDLQTNWRLRHLSVVPLFAETVRSASEDFESLDPNLNQLRQTQLTLEFAPTQSVRAKQFSQFTVSESSLLVKTNEEFVNPNLVSLSHKYRVPKRRFLRDKSKIRSHYAEQQVKIRMDKTEQRKELVKEREHKVTIYRSYRKGDLPDVQISLQAVLEPLQALSLHDGEVSKILYSQLFQSILQKMKNDQTFMEQVSSSIKFIFSNSIQYNRNLFRPLFDALLQCKNTIIFPADLIVSVSHSSGLRALGVLLLEEYLISHDTTSSDPKKSCGSQAASDTILWIKLAELYKEMDEWDVVKSIFLEKTESPENVKHALLAESRKSWEEAQEHYKNLLEVDESFVRKDFYYESYFKCFAHLGDWGNLVGTIDSIVTAGNDCWEDLWDEGFNQQKLMPWYISGQLKNTLFTENPPNQFFSNLNTSLNSERSEYLENHFCEEIAMLWIFKGDTDEAEKYLKMYMNKFLDYWQQLDLFYANLRYNSLLKLRNIIDINKFLSVFNNFNLDNTANIEELMQHWNGSAFESLPSILYCEEKVLYRRQFLNLLIKKVNSHDTEELAEITPQLNQVKFNLDEGIMDIGIEQNNFNITKKYLNHYNKQNVLKLKLVVSKLAFIKAATLNDSSRKIDFLLKGCDPLEQIFNSSGSSSLKLQAYEHFFKQLNEISLIFGTDNELFIQKQTDMKKLMDNQCVSSAEEIAAHGAKKLKAFLQSYENELDDKMESEENKRDRECETVAEAYVKLAYFAKKQEGHFSDFMLFVLRAMKFNSSEGRQLFPCIIMEKEFSEEDTKQFIEESSTMPVWMFLGWIPQILVNVDSPKVTAVAPLLLKIAEKYPQAIMYAYRLSKGNYNFQNVSSQELIEKLDALLLSNPQIDKFLTALSFVGIPAAILLYHVKKMMKFCQTKDVTQIKTILGYLQTEIFNCKPNSQNITSLQGNMFKKISKFDKDFKNFERSLNKGPPNAELLKKIDTELQKCLRDSDAKLLKDYCPWLANFSAHKANLELEIPGQYDGNRIPLIQHHVKISGFCTNVSVMPSIRKPIKVTILGNDTKEYPFLIKFGEDVRQDQRIQQLFSLMNNIFDNDRSLNGRKFSILTYQVIPLTTSLGIIQWIDNTSSLSEFVKNSAKDAKSVKTFDQLFETYYSFIFKPSNQSNLDAYGRAAMKYSRDKVIPKFRGMASAIEWDILRSQFLKISTNIESFFVLRNNFIKSYAVMCVGHWILGVGDRHLSNSLICLQNGKVLGIDFGHAFGTATQILPVPELVPFRLTPHLVSLMEPLGEKGQFREIMVHCLRSLRSNSGSLLATMNVFIEEPSLDWLEHASRFSASTETSDCMWYPAQKIEQAQKKLRGAKSSTIIVEDLQAGHQKHQNYMNAYIKLVEGVAAHDVRARIEGDTLSVEDQVDCLIDHATDYNLLGRMFGGWAAWV